MAAHDPFIGAWQLLSQVALDADGQPTDARGPHPIGLLIYQPNGWMSVQLMRRDRRSGLSLNAIHTAMSEYLGYFGTYVVNPASETVTHFVIGASFPGYINTQQVRFYRFEDDGDRLILAAEATLPGQTQRILTWKRA